MSSKWINAAIVACLVSGVTTTAASAQWNQGVINNQQGQINSDAATGNLTPGQAAGLSNREARIQAQQNAYLRQNGGVLTPGEKMQLHSELQGVQNKINNDVAKNIRYPIGANYTGVLPRNAYWVHGVPYLNGIPYTSTPTYVNGLPYINGLPVQTAVPVVVPANTNPNWPHHHHDWNNGNPWQH